VHNTRDKEEREDKEEKEEREEREKRAWIMENFQVISSSEVVEHVRKSFTTLNNQSQSRPTANNLSSFSSHTQTSLSSAHTVALNSPSLMPLHACGSFCPYLGSESGSGSKSGSSSARGIQKDRVRDKDKEKEKEKEKEEGSKDRGYAGDCVRGNQKDRVGSSDIDRVGSSERDNRVAWGTPRNSPTDTAISNSDNKYHSVSSGSSSDMAHDEEDRLTEAHTQHTQVHTQGYAQHTHVQGQGKGQGQVQVTREAILNLKSTEENESIWTDDSNSQLVSA
jgi:hypothetical protein